jgi:hypothetical protein
MFPSDGPIAYTEDLTRPLSPVLDGGRQSESHRRGSTHTSDRDLEHGLNRGALQRPRLDTFRFTPIRPDRIRKRALRDLEAMGNKITLERAG